MQPSIRVLNFKNTFESINCVPYKYFGPQKYDNQQN